VSKKKAFLGENWVKARYAPFGFYFEKSEMDFKLTF